MALVPKTTAFQFRVDPELLARFSALAALHGMTASEGLRRLMADQISRVERRPYRPGQEAIKTE